jgi:hypothetical protein
MFFKSFRSFNYKEYGELFKEYNLDFLANAVMPEDFNRASRR